MNTTAAVLYGPNQPFQLETLELAPPREGEVLVKMKAAGVCHSDWHLVTGATQHPLPVVPGHEGAGIVEAVGPGVTQVKPGDHIILNWAPNCGDCFYCLAHQPYLCGTYLEPIWAGTLLDGTTRLSKGEQPIYHFSGTACFAEYAVVPVRCCVPVCQTLPFAVAALIGCAVATGIGAVLNTACLKPGSSVVVYGAGGVGLNIIMGAKLAGAGSIIAVDKYDTKAGLARQFGATHSLIASENTLVEIWELTGGRGADYGFEVVGIPSIQEECFAAIRPGGVMVIVGLASMGSSTNFPGSIIGRQVKTITGCYYGNCHPARDFSMYADFYLQHKLPLDQLISRTYTLEQINEAYAEMLSGQVARGVIVF